MRRTYIPGTTIPQNGVDGPMFSLLKPMIDAADGLTLAQVSAITGLEYSTVQNWVKRGYVAKTVNKKYYGRHLARILIISMLRDSMKIEDIGETLSRINGDATDEKDDLLPEQDLYDCLCEVIKTNEGKDDEKLLSGSISSILEKYVPGNKDAAKKKYLIRALFVMLYAYRAGENKREAEFYYGLLKGETL